MGRDHTHCYGRAGIHSKKLLERANQVRWVLSYRADLESDFSAIHGIRNPYEELTGPQYFQMAYRMSAYKGVMQAHMATEAEKSRPKSAEEQKALYKAGALSPGEIKAMEYANKLGRGSGKR